MRKSRYSEEQIIGILREREAGASVTDLSRRHGVSEQTIYRWKQKYGGLEVSELKRLKASRSRECAAEEAGGGPSPRQPNAQGVARKKVVTPVAKREAAEYLQAHFPVSERYACRLVGVSRSTVRYRRRSRDDTSLVETAARTGPRTAPLRLSATARLAATGGGDGEPQTSLPTLSDRRTHRSSAQTQAGCRSAGTTGPHRNANPTNSGVWTS